MSTTSSSQLKQRTNQYTRKMKLPILKFTLVAATILCLIPAANGSALPPPSSGSGGPFSIQKIQHFLHNKCQNPHTNNASIWSYEGRLVDPTNGKVIANVEGIELVRSLAEMTQLEKADADGEDRSTLVWKLVRALRRLDDLKVRSILTAPGGGEWDFAGTTLSRKLFCYSPVEDLDEDNKNGDGGMGMGMGRRRGLLKEYRAHPTAPVRKIKTEEALALYDTATTFISREDGKEMMVMTEWPDGHWIQSVATPVRETGSLGVSSSSKNNPQTPFEFTVYAKKSGKGEEPMLPPSELAQRRANKSLLNAIPRSKLIQFGKDNTVEDQRFGARETYSYVMNENKLSKSQRMRSMLREAVSNLSESVGFWDFDIKSSTIRDDTFDSSNTCTVRYTRYGEAPPWYGPGKMCALELWGRKVESVADAPPLAATLAATRIPGFLSVHTPIPFGPPSIGDANGDNPKRKRRNAQVLEEKIVKEQMAADGAAIQAISWFRGREGVLPLEVLDDSDNEEGAMDSVIDRGLSVAQRLRAATTSVSD